MFEEISARYLNQFQKDPHLADPDEQQIRLRRARAATDASGSAPRTPVWAGVLAACLCRIASLPRAWSMAARSPLSRG